MEEGHAGRAIGPNYTHEAMRSYGGRASTVGLDCSPGASHPDSATRLAFLSSGLFASWTPPTPIPRPTSFSSVGLDCSPGASHPDYARASTADALRPYRLISRHCRFDVRWPSYVRPCKHGRHTPALSRKKESSPSGEKTLSDSVIAEIHGVAEAEEAVALPHGFFVSRQGLLPARQGAYQHDERRLRQVEIRDQAVQDLEPVPRIDKDTGPVALRVDDALVIRRGLDGPAAGGADADDPAARSLHRVDPIRRVLGDDIELRVHVVLQDVLLLHRAESSETHVERDMNDVNAHFFDLLQEFLREMQARCRCRGASVVLSVDRLIAVPVLQLVGDVGRKRHLSQLIQDLLEDPVVAELDKAVSFLRLSDDGPLQEPAAEAHHSAGAALLSRLHQGLPNVVLLPREKQHLDLRAGALFLADQPGGDDLCVVDDEAVPFPEISLNVPEGPVLDLPGLPVQDHQPRGSAVLQRILRDQLLRQFIIKLTYIHSCCVSPVVSYMTDAVPY